MMPVASPDSGHQTADKEMQVDENRPWRSQASYQYRQCTGFRTGQ
jgi:hypothetical protein